MIRTRLSGRFGNWLHQYCFGRILAEETNQCYTFWGKNCSNSEIGKIIKEYFPNITDIKGKAITPNEILIKRHLKDRKSVV